jgi:HlyD family secretion protein
MKRRVIAVLTLLSIAGAVVYTAASYRSTDTAPPARCDSSPTRMVTAPGTVEPISENVEISSELPGKLDRVVDEGLAVHAGQVIAVLANRDYHAQVAAARATLDDRITALRRLVNGARAEERQEALAAVEEADAVLANAVAERDRRRQLVLERAISREEADRAEQAWSVAQAKRRAAAERYALVDGAAREEDRARAEAAVAIARAALEQAEATLAKTYIRSPIDAVVLRRHHQAGETVLNSAVDPIVTIGDTSRLRVRAEIDELDVSLIRSGQRAFVRADTFGDRKFYGVLTRIGESLGKKRVRTGLPQERVDTKVLEVLMDLDDAQGLRPGLRVDVYVEPREYGTK